MRPNVALIVIPLAGTLACGASTVGPEDFVPPPGAPPPVVTDAAVYTLEHQEGGSPSVGRSCALQKPIAI